jgi:hypothetical protein
MLSWNLILEGGGLWPFHEIPVGLEGHGVRSGFPAAVSQGLNNFASSCSARKKQDR